MDALFTLVRTLARRERVTDVAAPKWLVQRHGLGPLVARAGVRSFREDLARSTLEWARTERELPGVVTSLVSEGARVVTLKGASYAKTLYASPAERPMADVDLLVRPDDRGRAERVLGRLGFEQRVAAVMHHAAPWARGDFVIDLHWHIISPGRSRIDLDAVWSRTRAAWLPDAEALDPVDALVFHLVHLTRNRLRLPLINVVDYARLLEQAAGEQALARAREWGVHTAVSLALRFCEDVIAGRQRPRAGLLRPSAADIALLAEPHALEKVVFDVLVAGSPRQLLSRIVHIGANRLSAWRSREAR